MAQNGTQWDLQEINAPLRLDDMLFLFLLVVISVVVGIKLLRSFRLSRAARLGNLPNLATHRDTLDKITNSLKQWLIVPFFAWGILSSHHLYLLCGGLLIEKNIHLTVPLYELRNLATELYLAFIVSFAAFLARWHVLKRLEKIRS
jgi:hypothetical protein